MATRRTRRRRSLPSCNGRLPVDVGLCYRQRLIVPWRFAIGSWSSRRHFAMKNAFGTSHRRSHPGRGTRSWWQDRVLRGPVKKRSQTRRWTHARISNRSIKAGWSIKGLQVQVLG
uniref:(northern house mosquito) hypothetical protein n=1 Tax=Culex pipiens TaxID=7175 RepID=A0A8D8ID48_CULPI